MKILMISHSLAEEGMTGRVIRATAEAFLAEGHQVLFFAEEDAASLSELTAREAEQKADTLARQAAALEAEAAAAEAAARQAESLWATVREQDEMEEAVPSPEEAERQAWIEAHEALIRYADRMKKHPSLPPRPRKKFIDLTGLARRLGIRPEQQAAEEARAAADDAIRAAIEAKNRMAAAAHEASHLRAQARQSWFFGSLLPEGAQAYTVQTAPVSGGRLQAQRLYNRPVEQQLIDLVRNELPDLALVYRVIGSLSMSVFAALQSFHIPAFSVITDHSLFCPAGDMIRNGAPCRLCAKGDPSACAKHRCINDQLRLSLQEAQLYRDMHRMGDFDAPDAYIAPSKHHQQQLLQSGLTHRPVINLDLPVPMPAAGLQRRGRSLLCVANLHEAQGHMLLLQAAAMQVHPQPLYLVGDGPDMAALKAESIRLGLGGRVHLLGRLHTRALQGYLDEAGAVLAAPHGDVIGPWALLQAQRMGKPVIVPPRGVLADRVIDGESGLVAEADSPEAMAQAMDRLDDLSDADYARLAEKTAAIAADRYDPIGYVRGLLALTEEGA